MNQATDECLATGGMDGKTKPPTNALVKDLSLPTYGVEG